MIVSCPSCGRPNRIPASRLDAKAHCGSCKTTLLPLNRPYDVPDVASFDELVQTSPLPVIIDFWAEWCGPCRMMTPELKRLAVAQAGRVVIAKVNSDTLTDIAARFQIRGIPALLRFDRGKETRRATGAQSAEALASALGLGAMHGGAEQPNAR